MNEGTGQGGERVIQREEDVDFKSSRQAEAMALVNPQAIPPPCDFLGHL